MGRQHFPYVDGQVVQHNYLLDVIEYDTYAELVAAALLLDGFNDTGKMYLCKATGSYYYWNGAALVIWPSTGGAGAPADRSYVTINAEPLLTGSVQHQNIVNQAQLHVNLLHKATHENAGTDEISVLGLSGLLADTQNAGWLQGKTIDAPVIGDDLKFAQYNHGLSKIQWAAIAGGGDMTAAVYDPDADNIVESADDAHTLDGIHAAGFATNAHAATHATGSTDPFIAADNLDGVARSTVYSGGVLTSSRRVLDFLPGTNTTWTITDVGGASDKMTLRVDASALTGLLPYETTALALDVFVPTTALANGQAVVVNSSHATDGGTVLFIGSGGAWTKFVGGL